MGLIPPAANCDNPGQMLATGELTRDLVPKVCPGGQSHRPFCPLHANIPALQKEDGCGAWTMLLAQRLGTASSLGHPEEGPCRLWELSASQVPDASQGPTSQSGAFLRTSHLEPAGSTLLCAERKSRFVLYSVRTMCGCQYGVGLSSPVPDLHF